MPQLGEQGRQVPLFPEVWYGQAGVHCPSKANRPSRQRVQVEAVPMQDKQDSSHPTPLAGSSISSLIHQDSR